eukprot:6603486-Pyramimonas_sp.AAC.1
MGRSWPRRIQATSSPAVPNCAATSRSVPTACSAMSSTTLRATTSGLPPAEADRRAASTGSLATV